MFVIFLSVAAAQPQDQYQEKLRQEVAEWNSRLRARSEGRAAGVPLRETAEARRRAMVELMRAAPSAALSLALSHSERPALVALDPALDGLLETHGRWSGDLEVYVFDDAEGKAARTVHYLSSPPLRLEVYSAGGSLPGECGWSAELEGITLDGVVAGFVTKTERAIGAGECSNLGEQKALGIAVSLPGMELSMSTADIEKMLFDPSPPSMDDFLRLTTKGQAWLTGSVTSVRLDRLYTCSEPDQLADAVFQALAGTMDLTAYRRFVLFFPAEAGDCWWAGLGNVNCMRRSSLPNHWRTVSWIRVPTTVPEWLNKTVHHELGHNFGLRHSNSRKYAPLALGGPGQRGEWEEYGDPFTVMGRGRAPYTARQSLHAGWLTKAQVIEANGEGTFAIDAIISANEGPKAIRIRRLADRDDWVWVEYHRPEGPYYVHWPQGVARGALVYVEDDHSRDASSAIGGYVDLLDMTPGSRPDDFRDALLAEGQEWRDAYSGLRIRVEQAEERLIVTVARDERCASVEPASRTHGPGEETGEFNVSADPSCQWEVVSQEPWIELTGSTAGSGNSIVTYRVQANQGNRPRRAFLAVGRNAVMVDQMPVNLPPAIQSVFPQEGSGSFLDLSIGTLDPNGPDDVSAISVRLGGKGANEPACLIDFDIATGEVRLESLGGAGWITGAAGSNLSLDNSLCRVTSASITLPGSRPNEADPLVLLRLGLRFHARFSGIRVLSVNARDRWGAESGWQEAGRWQVVDAPVSAFVSPRESAGPAVRLSFVWNTMPGGSPIRHAWIMIGDEQDWERSCVLYFEGQPDRISLYLGQRQWTPAAALAAATVLTSPSCRLLRPAVFRNDSTGAFWITANLAFPETFRGTKRVWMHAISGSGGEYPWTETGAINVTGPNAAPQISSLSHSTHSSPDAAITLAAEDENGAMDIELLEVLIGERRESFDACAIEITPSTQAIALRSDTGSFLLGSSTPSAPRVLENSQCRIDGSRSSITLAGNSLQVRLHLDLKAVLAGEQQVFVRVRDHSGALSAWRQAGPWRVPANPGSRPPDIALNGNMTSQGHFVSVPLRAQDPDSPRDVASIELLVGASPEDPAPCWMRFTRAVGLVELRSEDNTRWIQPAASDLQVAHRRCSVPARALLQTQGSAAFITLGATFDASFNGPKGLWARATDASGVSSGWRKMGDHTVSVRSANQPPTLVSSLPAAMRGASSTLSVSASDPDGTFDIRNLILSLVPAGTTQEMCRLAHDSLSRVLMVSSSEQRDWVVMPNNLSVESGPCTALSWFFQFSNTTPYDLLSGIAIGPSVSGALLVRARASDMAGAQSDWVSLSRWDVSHPNRPPAEVRVTQAVVGSVEGTLEISARDPDSSLDLASLSVTISSTGSRHNSCSFTLQPPLRRVSLFVDDLSLSYFNTIGLNTQLENGQCILPLRNVEMRSVDGALSVRMPLRFLAGLSGENTISVSVSDFLGGNLTVNNAGKLTVPHPSPNRPPEASSLQRQVLGDAVSVTATFSDPDGYGHLAHLDLRIGNNEAPSCAIRYDRTTHTVLISSDDGQKWQNPVPANSTASVSNSFCSFVPQQMRFSGSGQNLSWSLTVSVRPPLSPQSGFWLAAADRAGASTGWVRR